MSLVKKFSVILLVAALAACSGGQHNNQASTGSEKQSNQDVTGVMTGSPAPAMNNSTPVGAESAGNGGSAAAVGNGTSPGEPAPVPASLNCGNDQPVWVNQRSHAYHQATDPLYGRTKHGKYMCLQAAIAAGYHQAKPGGGHHMKSSSGAMTDVQPSPAAT